MSRVYRVAAVLFWGLTASSWCVAAQGVFAAEGDAAKGKSIYQSKCLTCHGPMGRGDGPIGKQLKPPAADFTSVENKKKSPEYLQKIIQNGVPKNLGGGVE